MFPTDPSERKKHPVGTGVLDYFPDALMAVARCSWQGNEQHNPGTPLHWDRSKSQDESDALIRHFLERGTVDTDGVRHSAKMAWRALALLQKEIEAERARLVQESRDRATRIVSETLKALEAEVEAVKDAREIAGVFDAPDVDFSRVERDPEQHRRNQQHQEEVAAELRRERIR